MHLEIVWVICPDQFWGSLEEVAFDRSNRIWNKNNWLKRDKCNRTRKNSGYQNSDRNDADFEILFRKQFYATQIRLAGPLQFQGRDLKIINCTDQCFLPMNHHEYITVTLEAGHEPVYLFRAPSFYSPCTKELDRTTNDRLDKCNQAKLRKLNCRFSSYFSGWGKFSVSLLVAKPKQSDLLWLWKSRDHDCRSSYPAWCIQTRKPIW